MELGKLFLSLRKWKTRLYNSRVDAEKNSQLFIKNTELCQLTKTYMV